MGTVLGLQRDGGDLTSGRRAVAAVDRALFIPDTIYVSDPTTGWLVPLRRGEDPERWRAHVDADAPLVTRVDFDARLPAELRDPITGWGHVSTSSSSAPHLMARMIELLELRPEMRVLEIGTGTGYNAAVLARLVGAGRVVSVEIEDGLADRARATLGAAGYEVEVVTGDGAAGHPGGALYDRVVATAAVRELPYAWVEQTRPGRRILAPWVATVHPDGPLGLLTVDADGVAEGRFVAPGLFMAARGVVVDREAIIEAERHWRALGEPECTRLGGYRHRGRSAHLDRAAISVVHLMTRARGLANLNAGEASPAPTRRRGPRAGHGRGRAAWSWRG